MTIKGVDKIVRPQGGPADLGRVQRREMGYPASGAAAATQCVRVRMRENTGLLSSTCFWLAGV